MKKALPQVITATTPTRLLLRLRLCLGLVLPVRLTSYANPDLQ